MIEACLYHLQTSCLPNGRRRLNKEHRVALHQRGSQGPEIARVRTRLRGLALCAGPIDGGRDERPRGLRRPILFDRHIFHGPISKALRRDRPPRPRPSGYSHGAHEYERLPLAIALDRDAALRRVSWGIGQGMGFNAEAVG